MPKKPVNLRLDEELLKDFDELEGTRTENMEEAMRLYLQRKAGVEIGKDSVDTRKDDVDMDVNTHKYEALQTELKHKEELIKSKNERINDLQVQLGWLQMEHSKLNDRILALPAPKNRRWRFWKK